MIATDEQREIAIRALLDVAQDRTVRPSQRIAAAGAVLRPEQAQMPYPDDDEHDAAERQQEEVYEDLYDAIAERVVAKIEPLAQQFREQIERQIGRKL